MDLVYKALEIMGKGMLAVFLVALILIIFVFLLNFFTGEDFKKRFKKSKSDETNSSQDTRK
ncbi:MAG TPA: hypothetical protein VIL26_05360 [Clostridia bacterium]